MLCTNVPCECCARGTVFLLWSGVCSMGVTRQFLVTTVIASRDLCGAAIPNSHVCHCEPRSVRRGNPQFACLSLRAPMVFGAWHKVPVVFIGNPHLRLSLRGANYAPWQSPCWIPRDPKYIFGGDCFGRTGNSLAMARITFPRAKAPSRSTGE